MRAGAAYSYSEALRQAIQAAGEAGVLFVAAAGNDGIDTDSYASYPSGYALDNIVSVAASDHADRLADFSNYGAASVDLAAPGVSILSALRGNLYGHKSGTSMAAPHVSGVLALILANSPNMTTSDLKQRILGTVDDDGLSTLAGKVFTGGRLSAAKAVGADPPAFDRVDPEQ